MNEIEKLSALKEEINTYIIVLSRPHSENEIYDLRANIREILSDLPLILP